MHFRVEAASGDRAGRAYAAMTYARVCGVALSTIFGSTISELACSEKSGTGSSEILEEKTSVLSFASSQNASMRKMKATRIDVMDKVSRMFQLSWVKYLGGNESSVTDDGEDPNNQNPIAENRHQTTDDTYKVANEHERTRRTDTPTASSKYCVVGAKTSRSRIFATVRNCRPTYVRLGWDGTLRLLYFHHCNPSSVVTEVPDKNSKET